MSHITEIVLNLSSSDSDEEEIKIDSFNAELAKIVGEDKSWRLFQKLDTDYLKGPKVFCNGVYAVCWNDCQEFIQPLAELFQQFDWNVPEEAVLIIQDEGCGSLVYRPRGY